MANISTAPKSARIEAASARTAQAYADAGISSIAPHRMVIDSCADCTPFQLYCVAPVAHIADLQGRKVRVQASSRGRDLVLNTGGYPAPLAFSEVAVALQ
ncbi:MAG: hypothetical protein ABIL01_30520, partial [Pseudomonadota bacterium]